MEADELDPDPLVELAAWHARAGTDEVCLATASADGVPHARMVLLKRLGPEGLDFYTNRTSAKGRDLAANPLAALVFRWAPSRQVRVSGAVVAVPDDECDRYWATRPRGSQLGAWASEQSRPIPGRSVLEDRLDGARARFGSGTVPRPPYWGGYRVVPSEVEFWCHREDRLHDRVHYRRPVEGGGWRRQRLAP